MLWPCSGKTGNCDSRRKANGSEEDQNQQLLDQKKGIQYMFYLIEVMTQGRAECWQDSYDQ